jgi:hypothetical protein
MSSSITKLPDNTPRIAAISISSSLDKDTCLIGAYLPCKGKTDCESEFDDNIEQIGEICQKYYPTHNLIICADFNTDLQDSSPRTKKVWSTLANFDLSLHNCPTAPTFFHYNDSCDSQIDYIISSSSLQQTTTIMSKDPANTPTHVPVKSYFKDFDLIKSRPPPISSSTHRPKPKWDSIDIPAYKLNIINYLHPQPLNTPLDIDNLLDHISKVLSSSVPNTSNPNRNLKRKTRYSHGTISALIRSRNAHKQWTNAGCPDPNHILSYERRSAKRILRQSMRADRAKKRHALYNDIMSSNANHDKLFYKIIATQRSTAPKSNMSLNINGNIITDDTEILNAWADHFETLSQPLVNSEFDSHYMYRVVQDIRIIDSLSQTPKSPPFQTNDIIHAIKQLNNNRAIDPHGLMAEHLKHAPPPIIPLLTELFNHIIITNHVPASLTCGDLITIPKKGKDHLNPSNYRGITITPVLCKVLEHLLMSKVRSQLNNSQHNLQFGFTKNLSPSLAALICTEVLSHNKDNKTDTFTSTLDVQKAFDCVWHDSLLRKLFITTKGDQTFKMFNLLITNSSIRVRSNAGLSREIKLSQGVGQGRIPSSDLYKLHLNNLIQMLESSGLGSHIGPFYCGAPTCADDILLLANSCSDLQGQLSLVLIYSLQERYIFNPSKTTISIYPGSRKRSDDNNPLPTWQLGKSNIIPTETFTHLGVTRSSTSLSPHSLITDRIKLARRTAYSLLGVGLHGLNGLSPPIALHIYDTYVTPRLLYNLDVIILTAAQIEKMELFHRHTLRALQGLPDRVASPAIFLLIGTLPLEATIHRNILNRLGFIANQPGTLTHNIGLRQLSTKDCSSNSWFIYALKIAAKYSLPSPHLLFEGSISLPVWRSKVKAAVTEFWRTKLICNAATKSSLSAIDCQALPKVGPHYIWCVDPNTRDVARARIKCKLLTGSYTLQSNRAKFNALQVDPTCPLCRSGVEDRTHFLITCPALASAREKSMDKLLQIPPQEILTSLTQNPIALSVYILDTGSAIKNNIIPNSSALLWEFHSRNLCFYLHVMHECLLADTATSKQICKPAASA